MWAVDISDAAIRIAAKRSKLAGRTNNQYTQGEITEYVAAQLLHYAAKERGHELRS